MGQTPHQPTKQRGKRDKEIDGDRKASRQFDRLIFEALSSWCALEIEEAQVAAICTLAVRLPSLPKVVAGTLLPSSVQASCPSTSALRVGDLAARIGGNQE